MDNSPETEHQKCAFYYSLKHENTVKNTLTKGNKYRNTSQDARICIHDIGYSVSFHSLICVNEKGTLTCHESKRQQADISLSHPKNGNTG